VTALLTKLVSLELALSAQRGDFELFGIFLRDDAQGKWDLIAAAPWLHSNDRASLEIIVSGMQKTLSPGELLMFSRVIVLDKGNPFLEDLLKAFSTEHSPTEIESLTLNGRSFRRIYLFTAQRRLAQKPRRN
jgi:predicted TPR repeat methyltransferase